jgi:hypothetical protein
MEADQDLRTAAAGAWWLAWAPAKAVVFTLHIRQALFVDWDINRGLMTVHRWSPASGYAVASRPIHRPRTAEACQASSADPAKTEANVP